MNDEYDDCCYHEQVIFNDHFDRNKTVLKECYKFYYKKDYPTETIAITEFLIYLLEQKKDNKL